jgi:hypothetical protein
MTALVQTSVIPRGTYTGTPLCRPRGNERFYQCPICGGWIDAADPHQVMEHEGGASPIQATPVMPVAEAS